MADFQLHPQLQQDCIYLGRFDLCQVLLLNNRLFPWVLLVPEREDAQEIYSLDTCLQAQLWRESKNLSKVMMELFAGDKLNVASIGNQVPQLHLHHIVRYHDDSLWPQTVWGNAPSQAYNDDELQQRISQLQQALQTYGLITSA